MTEEPTNPIDAERQALQQFISNARKNQKAEQEPTSSIEVQSREDLPDTIIEEGN